MGSRGGARPEANEMAVWRNCTSHAMGVLRARYVRQSFPPHFHETFVVCVNERGAHSSWYRGARAVVPERTLCVVPPGEVHTGQRVAAAPWHYRAMYPGADQMAGLARDAGLRGTAAPAFKSLCLDDPRLADAFMKAHVECEVNADPLAVESAVVQVLSALLRRHGSGSSLRSGPQLPARRAQIAADYLRDCLAERVTLDDLAQATALSHYAVLRVFRREMGVTPHRYLTQVRVERARHLLLAGLSPAAVAQQVGFADQSHLTRHFRRLVGVTPGVFART